MQQKTGVGDFAEVESRRYGSKGRCLEYVWRVYRHHVSPREQLHVPTESSFPIPPTYTDVVRKTKSNLDILAESSIDDRWNIDEHGSSLRKLERIHEIPHPQEHVHPKVILGVDAD